MIGIISAVGSIATSWFETKKVKSQNKTAIELAKNNRLSDVENNKADWELVQAEAGKHSWKDEFLTVVLSIPLILAFFPAMSEHIGLGFEVLMGLPEWYKYSVMTMIGASFGVKQFSRMKK